METTEALIKGINGSPGLRVLGEPDMSVFAFTSDGPDINAVADQLAELGWSPDRQQSPPALHLMVTPVHKDVAPAFLADLRTAVEHASAPGSTPREGAAYGMAGAKPDKPGA